MLGFTPFKRHPNKFNYIPRYYDPEKEAVKEKFASVDGSMEKKDYVPGSYVKGAFKREDRYRTSGGRTRMIVSLAGLLLIIVALIYIAKMYPSLVSSVDKQQKENRGIVTDEQDPDQYRIVDLNRPY